MKTPNIFRFATSELSQDAVLAYILAWADVKYKGDGSGMHNVGQDFAKQLLRNHESQNAPDSIETVEVDTQYQIEGNRRADVVAFINKKYVLLIEDKINATESGDQLAAYLQLLREKYGADKVFPVYLKTGYIFDDEKEVVSGKGYNVFGLNDLVRLFEKHENSVKDGVFTQYLESCASTLKKRDEEISSWNFEFDYVQWEFMLKLKEKLERGNCEWMDARKKLPQAHRFPDNFPEWAAEGGTGTWVDDASETFIKRGASFGSPWTQYWFTKFLFWRIDDGDSLRLRFGVWPPDKVPTEDPWRAYQACFEKSIENTGLTSCAFQTKSNADERTVGAIECVDVKTFLDNIATFHKQFVENISKVKWGN